MKEKIYTCQELCNVSYRVLHVLQCGAVCNIERETEKKDVRLRAMLYILSASAGRVEVARESTRERER